MVIYNKEQKITQLEFEKIYTLLSESLPREERRSFKRQFNLFTKEAYQLYVETSDSGEILGFLAAWEFEHLRYIEHLAVDERFRGSGIGGKILKEYLERDNRLVVLEVDLPETPIAKRRIGFYERHGFCLNEFYYEQLPLNEGDKPLPLFIMTYPIKLSVEEFEKEREFLYEKVYRVSMSTSEIG